METKKKTYYSEVQKRATAKYNAKAYDEIKLRVKKGEKDILKDFAEQQGETLNSLIRTALLEYARNHNYPLNLL